MEDNKPCWPFYLQSFPVQNQTYTLTEPEKVYQFTPWTAYPQRCIVEYEYSLDPPDPKVEQYISLQGSSFVFESSDYDLSIFGGASERNVTVVLTGAIGDTIKFASRVFYSLNLKNPCHN